MTAAVLKQTRMTILLSINAVAILVAGVLIASAIAGSGGDAAVVAERNDTVEESVEEAGLLESASQFLEGIVSNVTGGGSGGGSSEAVPNTGGEEVVVEPTNYGTSNGNVPNGELWSTDSITIYATAERDICIDDTLPGLDNMYWQTSNTGVIAAFYAEARSYLGYSTNKCRFPKIVGTGTTVITAGTYDGARRDSLTVTVVDPPAGQWKQEVLSLVNAERARAGVGALAWGSTCEGAANTRAVELKSVYAHTRPDGSAWHTVCPIPSTGGKSGENLAAGASVPSPATVVSAWMNSPEHRQNILDPDFKFLSVGFTFDANSQYKVYWSQIFTTY